MINVITKHASRVTILKEFSLNQSANRIKEKLEQKRKQW